MRLVLSPTPRNLARARRAAPLGVAVGLALAGGGCDSTGLSLDDPNQLNATLKPPFVSRDETRHNGVELTLDGEAEADVTGDITTNYVISADFGQGLGGTGYQFTSNFSVTFDLLRFTEATSGVRTFTVKFHNYYGDFLARGELNVYE